MTQSVTAQNRGIDNTPDEQSSANLEKLCQQILQPIRDAWGAPIIVSSGYRCPALNKIVGGAAQSDHMYGCAADIKTVVDTPERNKALFLLIKQMYEEGKLPRLKQCINEYGYNWLHVSYQDGRSNKHGQFIHIKR